MKSKLMRISLIIIVSVAIAVALFVVYARIFGGHVLQREVSPDGSVVAEVTESDDAGATDVAYAGVTLKTKLRPIRHYVFGGLDYGVQIKVSWIDNDRLLINCQHCENLNGGNIIERKWRDVMICYARSNVIEPQFMEKGKSCPAEP